MSARCEYMSGSYPCGAVLQPVIDRTRFGQVTYACGACERRVAGICRDCPSLVEGKVGQSRRCTPCRVAFQKASRRRYVAENRAKVARSAKKWLRRRLAADPAAVAQRRDYARAWKLANPGKLAEYRRREGLRQSAAKKRYAKAHPVPYRPGVKPARYCLTGCGTVVTSHAKKCAPCKQAATEQARQALASGAFRTSTPTPRAA